MDIARYHKDHHLKIEIQDRIALLTLDRPDKHNAVNYALHKGLEAAFEELSHHPDVGAIVITGAGRSFCAGGDLVGFNPPDPSPLDIIRNRGLNWSQARCEAPLIAAVNGTAAGLGASIALTCDVVYMAESARIGDTHVKVGLVAGDGGQVMWPLLVGLNRAKEYLMAGELIDAAEADRIDLVNRVLPDDELLDYAMNYARKVANGAQVAIRWTKMAINKMLYQQLNANLEFGLATEQICSSTEDTQEAMAAFREKRTPHFKGR